MYGCIHLTLLSESVFFNQIISDCLKDYFHVVSRTVPLHQRDLI